MGLYLGKYFTKYAIIWQIFLSGHIDQMCKFSSKSGGGVPFQISFFWGDLTRNDPTVIIILCNKVQNSPYKDKTLRTIIYNTNSPK